MNFILNNLIDILLVLVGATGLLTYYLQSRSRKRDAAALIITQIEELKEKMLNINSIYDNNAINEKAIYETLDIINDNQWEKYKHLFINKIDSYSFKTISQFYECTLSIREQLVFVKQLQHNQYFNIQGMLDTNCNAFLMDSMQNMSFTPKMQEFKKSLLERNFKNEEEQKQATYIAGVIDELMKANPNYDFNQFWRIYDSKKSVLRNIVNSSPYISYVPLQVAETLNKSIKNINSIEIIGCDGFKKLKRISKIK